MTDRQTDKQRQNISFSLAEVIINTTDTFGRMLESSRYLEVCYRMAALRRCGHYIFAVVSSSSSFFLSSPNLSGH